MKELGYILPFPSNILVGHIGNQAALIRGVVDDESCAENCATHRRQANYHI